MKNVGNSSRGHSQGVPNFFRAPMYRGHCAVIFAIAQLSCPVLLVPALGISWVYTFNIVSVNYYGHSRGPTFGAVGANGSVN